MSTHITESALIRKEAPELPFPTFSTSVEPLCGNFYLSMAPNLQVKEFCGRPVVAGDITSGHTVTTILKFLS